MYCSVCRKEVDINSVMKQTHTGTFSNVNPFTGLESSVSSTKNELVNVCKSCGQTGCLYKSEDDYKNHLNLKKQIQERKAQKAIREHVSDNFRYKNPLLYAALLPTVICGMLIVGGFLVAGFQGEMDSFLSFLLFYLIMSFLFCWLPFFFWALNDNKKFLKLEREKRFEDYKSKSKQ